MEYNIDEKKKRVELQCAFTNVDIEAKSQEVDTRIKDILVRLENLKIAFDRKNEIFR